MFVCLLSGLHTHTHLKHTKMSKTRRQESCSSHSWLCPQYLYWYLNKCSINICRREEDGTERYRRIFYKHYCLQKVRIPPTKMQYIMIIRKHLVLLRDFLLSVLPCQWISPFCHLWVRSIALTLLLRRGQLCLFQTFCGKG